MNYQTFTDTVTPTLKSLGSFNNSLKIVLKTVFTTRISNIISDTGRCEGYCYWEYDVVSLNASILSNPENYAKAVAEFSIYGKADDGFKFYLNGTNITTFASVCNHGSCTSKSDWIPSLHSFEYSLTSKTNNLLIKAYSIKNDYWAEIYSAILTIKTESKQFTDTLNPISIEISTLNKQLSNTVTYIFFNGEVKAQINYSSVIGCMRGVCLSEMNSSLSMWTTLSEFSVRVLSAGGNHSENIIVSSHTASYYGDYAVVYTKTGKIVKKGSYSVSCIVPAGNMGTPAYGQSGVFTIP